MKSTSLNFLICFLIGVFWGLSISPTQAADGLSSAGFSSNALVCSSYLAPFPGVTTVNGGLIRGKQGAQNGFYSVGEKHTYFFPFTLTPKDVMTFKWVPEHRRNEPDRDGTFYRFKLDSTTDAADQAAVNTGVFSMTADYQKGEMVDEPIVDPKIKVTNVMGTAVDNSQARETVLAPMREKIEAMTHLLKGRPDYGQWLESKAKADPRWQKILAATSGTAVTQYFIDGEGSNNGATSVGYKDMNDPIINATPEDIAQDNELKRQIREGVNDKVHVATFFDFSKGWPKLEKALQACSALKDPVLSKAADEILATHGFTASFGDVKTGIKALSPNTNENLAPVSHDSAPKNPNTDGTSDAPQHPATVDPAR